jgi:hypothetical protein
VDELKPAMDEVNDRDILVKIRDLLIVILKWAQKNRHGNAKEFSGTMYLNQVFSAISGRDNK